MLPQDIINWFGYLWENNSSYMEYYECWKEARRIFGKNIYKYLFDELTESYDILCESFGTALNNFEKVVMGG